MNNDDAMITAACDGLLSSVKRYLRIYEKRALKRRHPEAVSSEKEKIMETVHHACFVVQQLAMKRKSFQSGVEAISNLWKTKWFPMLLNSSDNNDANTTTLIQLLQSILSHVFQQYLRLRDGIVLMTSGECRHPGDVKEVTKKTKNKSNNKKSRLFTSRLSSLSTCQDGYTKVYSSTQGYSGYGWDELFNETVGIQHRLVEYLAFYSTKNSKSIWDTLLDHGGQTFESVLDTHDMELHQYQQLLDKFKCTMEKDIQFLLHQNASGGSIHIITQDKMERIDVTIYHTTGSVSSKQSSSGSSSSSKISEIRLERLANNFVVQDPNGVLPDGWSKREWTHHMKLVITNNLRSEQQRKKSSFKHHNANSAAIRTTASSATPLQQHDSSFSHRDNINDKRAAARRRKRVIQDSSSSEEEEEVDKKDGNGDGGHNSNKKLKVISKSNSGSHFLSETESTNQQQKQQQKQDSSGGGGLRVRVKEKSNQLPSPSSNNNNNNVSVKSDHNDGASLAAIKLHFGVNAAELQASRDELEAEEQNNTKRGNHDTTTTTTTGGNSTSSVGIHGLSAEQQQAYRMYQEEIQQQKSEISKMLSTVQHRRQNYLAATTRQEEQQRQGSSKILTKNDDVVDDDDYEIWDAREYLRESLMTLGNLFFSLHNTIKLIGRISPTNTSSMRRRHNNNDDHDDDTKYRNGYYLQEAEKNFRGACDLVQVQEKSHTHSTKMTNDEASEESNRIRRRLLLLAGRSRTNLGIALIEQGLLEKELCKKKKSSGVVSDKVLLPRRNATIFATFMERGINELELGRAKASAMRAKAMTDKPESSSILKRGSGVCNTHYPEETAMDLFEADELYCLASRWLGKALWYKGNQQQDAIQVYEDAARLFVDKNRYFLHGNHQQLMEGEFSLGIETFYCFSTLAELAIEAMEELPSLPKFESKGNDLLSIALRAYELAEVTSRKIKQMTKHPNSPWTMVDLVETRELSSAEQISSLAVDVKLWWDRKKETMPTVDKSQPLVSSASTKLKLARNDLSTHTFGSGQQSDPKKGPTKRFYMGGAPLRRLIKTTLSNQSRNKSLSADNNAFDTFEDIGNNDGGVWPDNLHAEDKQVRETVSFRIWGDELFSKTSSGKSPAQCFPSVAPPHPGKVSVQ